MCLIITGPSAHIRNTLLNTKGMLADVFNSNADGLGVMYKNKRGLRVVKTLPKTLAEVTRLVDSLPGDDRQVAMHWRMRTHGSIDLANCHPYDVLPGRLAMMHNGILSTGNEADVTKSDTWHFIQNYLAGPAALSLDLVHDPAFVTLLAEFIGGNKFVFMDLLGRLSIVNKDQGVGVGELWFSNTYAWSPEMLIAGYKKATPYHTTHTGSQAWRGYYQSLWETDAEDDTVLVGGDADTAWEQYRQERDAGPVTSAVSLSDLYGTPRLRYDFEEAVLDADTEYVASVLAGWPYTPIGEMLRRYTPETAAFVERTREKFSGRDLKMIEAVLAGNEVDIGAHATKHPEVMADVICFYLEWVPHQGQVQEAASDDDLIDLGAGAWEYAFHRIDAAYDPDLGYWHYTVTTPDGMELDQGYGYVNEAEALEWACHDINKAIKEVVA